LRNWASAKRIQLKLLNLTPRVADLLNITQLTPIFDVCSVQDMIELLFREKQSSLGTRCSVPEEVASMSVPGL